MDDNTIQQLTQKVLTSKKYKSIYPPTVERIVIDMATRYPAKQVEKAVKRRLHQIWGAYFTRPNFDKLVRKVQDDLIQEASARDVVLPLLQLQTSTNERIPILDTFYAKIFSITGTPQKILEPACGLNALTYFWMDMDIEYVGIDVDQEEIDFINTVFSLCGVKSMAKVALGDVLADSLGHADVVLLLKVLPLLEHQIKGCSLDVMRSFDCDFIVVSYPTRSISGKRKGMTAHYTETFMDMVKDEPWNVEKIVFESELVFVVKK